MSINVQVEGELRVIGETVQVSDRFKKREFVVYVDHESWPQHYKIKLTQDRCSLIDSYKVGDTVKVSANVEGRRWEKDGNAMYFTTLKAWRIEALSDNPQPATQPADDGTADDLPF